MNDLSLIMGPAWMMSLAWHLRYVYDTCDEDTLSSYYSASATHACIHSFLCVLSLSRTAKRLDGMLAFYLLFFLLMERLRRSD